MQIMIGLMVTWYGVVAAMLFSAWYQSFQRDQTMSVQERQFSWVVLVVPTVFWFFCLPLSYLEILRKRQQAKALAEHASAAPVATVSKDHALPLSTLDHR
jgi:tellurite resistance protein TehA-like permease